MERAIRKISSFDPEKAGFGTWLTAIARNRWLDEVRKNAHYQPGVLIEADTKQSSPDAYDAYIDHDELLCLMKGLKPEVRTPISLNYLLGYSYDDIAKQMKVPLGTIKSRISNGLKQLRKEMAK